MPISQPFFIFIIFQRFKGYLSELFFLIKSVFSRALSLTKNLAFVLYFRLLSLTISNCNVERLYGDVFRNLDVQKIIIKVTFTINIRN